MMELSIGPKIFQLTRIEMFPGEGTFECDDWCMPLEAFFEPHPLKLEYDKVVYIQLIGGLNGRFDFILVQ
jgi:hypothetical protein